MLNWVLDASMNIVQNLEFRDKILRLLVKLFHELAEPDYDSVCQCFIHLNDPSSCAQMLKDLVARDEVCKRVSILLSLKAHRLVALQIAFDLEDNATQEFLIKVLYSRINIDHKGYEPSATSNTRGGSRLYGHV